MTQQCDTTSTSHTSAHTANARSFVDIIVSSVVGKGQSTLILQVTHSDPMFTVKHQVFSNANTV